MDAASIYVTCPDEETAVRIARTLLDERLIACANILPEARSLYRWEGAIEDAREVVMFLKTRRALVAQVERVVATLHPYEVPCILALEVTAGNERFLAWLSEEARPIRT